MQDIKISVREREISNHKHGRIVLRFEHTCSTSPPSTLWKIFTITISKDHSIPQHLQRVHTRTLGPASPSLVPTRTTHASTLACWGRTSYNSSNHKLEHLVITSLDHHKTLFTEATTSILLTIQEWILVITSLDHKNNSHNKDPKMIVIAMKSLSLCEKNKIELWRKTQEISF